MANRYTEVGILKTDTGKRYRKSIRYPEISQKSTDRYIISRQGDRLDNLAYTYYQDSRLWWIIARANNLGKGDLEVPIGKQIRIPSDYVQIYNSYLNLNGE